MTKYFLIAKNTWDEIFTYRVSFFVWRIRMILQLVTVYFLWFTLIPQKSIFLQYSHQTILTYVLGTSIIGTLVFTLKSWQIGDEINNGNLSNYLLRPINFFSYWFARNVGDKAISVLFSMIEIALVLLLFHPPVLLQTNFFILLLFILSFVIAVFVYTFFDFLLNFIAFWSPESWAPRFIFYATMPFLAGNMFPLDILPKPLFFISQILPFQYTLYFPLKIYLGQMTVSQTIFGISIEIVWLFILLLSVQWVWKKGLLAYTSEGR